MSAKTTLFALLLTGFGLSAQSQPAPAPNADTNRDELLRQALRQAIEAKTNSATAKPIPAAALSVPVPTPPVQAAPAASTETAPPGQTAPAAPADSTAVAAENPAPPGTAPTDQAPPAAATNRVALPNIRGADQIAPADSLSTATNRFPLPTNPVGGPPSPATRVALPSFPASPSAGPPGPGAVPSNPAASSAPAPTPGPPSITSGPPTSEPGSPAATNAPSGEDLVLPGGINFRAVDLNDVLTLYSEYVGRTILRPNTLPAVVITLKNQTALTKREVIQALEAALALNGISLVPVGDKFVKVLPSANANQAGAALHEEKAKDLPEMGSYVTHIVQVKYVKPSELQQVLTPFASQIPNPILPIDGSQILVLRDYTENVKRMLEMVEKIDVAVEAEFTSEVIPIKYALASDISAALNALSAGGGGTTVGAGAGGGGTRGGLGGRTGSGFGGGQRSLGTGLGGAGGGYPGTYGTPGTTPQGAQPGVGTAPGTGGTFSDRLRSIIQRAGGGGAGEIQVIGTTKIIADERTNSLLIFASKTDMQTIKKIIAQLDVVLAQVLIETVIIEYTLGPDTKSFGFTYIQHPQSVGNFNSVGTGGGGQFFDPGSFLGLGTNTAQGLQDGFHYIFSFGQDLDVAVSAIEANSKGKVLQRPRIQTSHAVPAQIFVGESRPYPQGSYYGGGSFGGYSTIQQLQIGVTLEVTPLINPDGLVVMDIHQTIENYAGFTEIQGVGQVPITTRKEAAAKVAVRDRDTIMLGGLIETDKSKSHSGVPFLMDVPLLGYLFRSTSTSDTRKELIIMIRPSVLPTPEVAALTARSEKEKMAGVRETEREIMEENAARLREADKHLKQQ